MRENSEFDSPMRSAAGKLKHGDIHMGEKEIEANAGWWAYQASRLRRAAKGAGSTAANISEYVGATFIAVLSVWHLHVTITFTGEPTIDTGLTSLALAWVLTVFWRFVFGAPYQMQRDLHACWLKARSKAGRLKSQISPEIARQSPRYLALRIQLNPDTGTLAPVSRIKKELEMLEELSSAVRAGDGEAYYIATDIGEWLLADARRHYGSTTKYHEIQTVVQRALLSIHEAFAKHLK